MVDMQILKIVNYKNISKWNVPDLIHKNLSGKYENLSLYNFLERDKTVVNIQDDILYKQITVHQYGEGVSLRCEKKGKEIGTKRQFLAKKGQLIVSGIDARNGSVGLITDYLDGGIVTNDFWLFNLKNVDSKFMQLLLSLEKTSNYMQSKSNGTTNRQRVNIQDFLQIKMPVPSLEEQKTIIKKYGDAIAEAEKLEKNADEEISSIEKYIHDVTCIPIINDEIESKLLSFSKFSDLSEKWTITPLMSEINQKLSFSKYPLYSVSRCLNCVTRSWKKSSEKNETFQYIEIGGIDIENETISSSTVEVKKAPSRATQIVKTGDLIFGLTRPYLKKFAIIDESHNDNVCSSGFQVIKPSDNYRLEYILEIFKSNICVSQFKEAMTGALYPALNADQLGSIRIPLPPLSVQEEIVSHINEIKANVKSLRKQAADLRTKAKQDFENAVFN